jgi:NitT/TauT family transport system substrate-binding protein
MFGAILDPSAGHLTIRPYYSSMAKFRIHTHQRLQEWVAEEKGYFKDEGLEYEFGQMDNYDKFAGIQVAESAPEINSGAFESYEEGRSCEVSTACHWMINVAASAQHGRMWGHAYSVCPAAIMVPPESKVQTPDDLRDVEIGVGYHSGSHFSALQALEPFIAPKDVKLKFVGWTMRRLEMAYERAVGAANVFGTQMYVLEQHGFRKILDTTFMMGYLLNADVDLEDAGKYFRGLRRAQQAIDLQPELYKHHYLKELPEKFHSLVDVKRFGPGERIVFEPYTREMYEWTYRWTKQLDLLGDDHIGQESYQEAVLV